MSKLWEISRVPRDVYVLLADRGIEEDTLRLAFTADMDRDHRTSDTYVFLTDSSLTVVYGTRTVRSEGGMGRLKGTPLSGAFYLQEMLSLPLDELSSLLMEDTQSGARLIAKHRDGTQEMITAMSGFAKASSALFVRYTNLYLKNGDFEIDPDDLAESHTCPVCGMRYPDKNRRICPRCMNKGSLFRRMFSFFGKYKRELILSVLSLVLLTAVSTAVPYISAGFFYDQVLSKTGRFYGEVLLVLLLLVSARLLSMLATMVNNYVTSVIAARVVYDLKKVIFGSIERLSLSFFTARQTGGLMTQVNRDANTIYDFFCDGVPYFLINAVQVIVLTVVLLIINPILALCALITVPFFFLLMRRFYKNQSRMHARRYSGSKRLTSFLSDFLSGIRVVKAFAREKEEGTRFDEANRTLAASDRELAVYHNYANPLAAWILNFGTTIVWAVGGYMVITDAFDMSYGVLATFIAAVAMIYSPLHFFVDMVNRTADCSNAMQRLFEMMDAEPEVVEKDAPVKLDSLTGELEFRGVNFSYQKNKKVIKDVSFHVNAGEKLGIVGHTGAGKSTLANLLIRLYDTDSGDILIDGHSVRDLSFEDLHRYASIVSQETYLFVGTVLDNIRYAAPNASREDVLKASKLAGCHDFIMRMSNGYETKIGFGYQELSGGEKQRISIARALLKNPRILILDEATAAMDTQTEQHIQAALARLSDGKTTITIAHRLSTLRDSDALVVIENGEIVERGTQTELLARKGVYHRLYTLQEEALKNAGIAE